MVGFAALLAGMVGRAWAADGFVEGEVIVTWRSTTTLEGAKTSAGRHAAELGRHFAWLSNHHHQVMGVVRSGKRSTAAMIKEMRDDPEVLVAEPNYIRHVSTLQPNDPYFGNLWGLNNTGQSVNSTAGTSGDDIRFTAAWDLARPTSTAEVVVAVIDTGLDTSHPDIAANLWTNSGETVGNGLDDDGNGYVDDVHGYNFVDGNSDIADSGYHGTHVAGTIAAAGNNSLGVIGVAFKSHVMVLKVSNDGDTISTSAEISALQYAAMMKSRGVNIVAINASFGGNAYSSAESAAIQAAGDVGIVFCAAAGNSSTNNDTTPSYPASYRLSNMIVVAASDQNDQLASFSNYGATTVDIAAPGTNIFSLCPAGIPTTTAMVTMGTTTYNSAQGMSFAGASSGITATLINCGFGNSASEFPSAVRNNIALIQRGTQTFATKVTNAMNAGAVGAIIYNNVAGDFGGTLATAGTWIPVVSVSQTDGTSLLAVVNTPVTMANSLPYQYLDGTSMATPHVTGAVAFAAMNFTSETAAQRVARVVNHTTAVPALAGKVKNGGRLNLLKMIDTGSTLAGLTLSSGTLTPTFAPGTTSYTASVANASTGVTVTPTVTDATATVTVNGAPVTSGTASASIPLALGNNQITVLVTAQDGISSDTYTISVTRQNPAPSVTTGAASGITTSAATLNGTVNPNGLATTAKFEYGLTAAYGSLAGVTLLPDNGTTVQNVSANISGLQPGTTYHYHLTATNGNGTSPGDDMTFGSAKALPVITWVNPAVITYGTALTVTQLKAKANVPGQFVYSPALGTKLPAGNQTLSVTFSPTDSTHYDTARKSVPLIVNKATATVTLVGLSQTFNGQPRVVTTTTVPAGLNVGITYNGSATVPVNAGSYVVNAMVLNDNVAGSKTGKLVVAKAAQTITFPTPPTLRFGDADYALAATASSGLAVVYASSAPAVGTIVDGNKLHILGTGRVTIMAIQSGDTNWKTAVSVKKVLVIGKRSQTIDFAAFSGHAVGEPDFSPGATATSGLTVTYASASPAVATIVAGKIHLVGQGAAVITARQAGNTLWAAAAEVTQILTVQASQAGVLAVQSTPSTGAQARISDAIAIDVIPYDSWKATAFPNVTDRNDPALSGELATPANDGITNLMKYALALDPMTCGTDGLPTASPQGGYLTLTYRKNKQAVDVTYTVQSSDSLNGIWAPATTVTSQADQGTYTVVTVRDTVPGSGYPHRFMRLQVSR